MNTMDKEKIRETVRNRYGEIAKADGLKPKTAPESDVQKEMLPMVSCCPSSGTLTQGQRAYCSAKQLF